MNLNGIPKIAFQTHEVHYEFFIIIPLELTNTLAKNEELEHLRQVLNLLKQHYLYAKKFECKLAIKEIGYLGHVINVKGVTTDSSKVITMLEWLEPKNVKSLRRFIGLTRCYSKFRRNFSHKVAPLTVFVRNKSFS